MSRRKEIEKVPIRRRRGLYKKSQDSHLSTSSGQENLPGKRETRHIPSPSLIYGI